MNAASVAAAPGLIESINRDPTFAADLNTLFMSERLQAGLKGFATGGYVTQLSPPSLPASASGPTGRLLRMRPFAQSVSTARLKEHIEVTVTPEALPNGDLGWATRKAESNRRRLGYT